MYKVWGQKRQQRDRGSLKKIILTFLTFLNPGHTSHNSWARICAHTPPMVMVTGQKLHPGQVLPLATGSTVITGPNTSPACHGQSLPVLSPRRKHGLTGSTVITQHSDKMLRSDWEYCHHLGLRHKSKLEIVREAELRSGSNLHWQ